MRRLRAVFGEPRHQTHTLAEPLHRRPNAQHADVEVDVLPPQGEQLSLAQSEGDTHGEEGAQPVPLERGQELTCLVRGPRDDLLPLDARSLDQGRDVAVDQLIAFCIRKHRAQHRPAQLHRSGRDAGLGDSQQ
ncbi:hypothetical protein [Janibacter terrae]|uniref:hypothetical protein n=1 Tax=Janibacter terrae TaxID=103817 RepID=UPI000833F46B|nr:hypothetical protein [Janibacter terrae]